jgi:carbon monoxide dehydrogenase subunit G
VSLTLDHQFVVPLPADETWAALMDVQRVALCMPGATLESVDDGEFHGKVSVKLGPITTRFRGQARFGERDDDARRAVLVASGREIGGSSTAEAAMTLRVAETDAGSAVSVSTELAITGKVARFGRGVIGEVAGRLVDQFATALTAELVGATAPTPEAPTVAPTAEAGARPETPASAPAGPSDPAGAAELDLAALLLGPEQRRRLQQWSLVALVAVLLLGWRRRRHDDALVIAAGRILEAGR